MSDDKELIEIKGKRFRVEELQSAFEAHGLLKKSGVRKVVQVLLEAEAPLSRMDIVRVTALSRELVGRHLRELASLQLVKKFNLGGRTRFYALTAYGAAFARRALDSSAVVQGKPGKGGSKKTDDI